MYAARRGKGAGGVPCVVVGGAALPTARTTAKPALRAVCIQIHDGGCLKLRVIVQPGAGAQRVGAPGAQRNPQGGASTPAGGCTESPKSVGSP